MQLNTPGGHESEAIRPYTLRLKLLFAVSIIQYWGHLNSHFFYTIVAPKNHSFFPERSSATDRSRVKSSGATGTDRLTAKFQKHELKT
jgi:hypothetical protein